MHDDSPEARARRAEARRGTMSGRKLTLAEHFGKACPSHAPTAPTATARDLVLLQEAERDD
jgi:hypothetical protein